VNEAPDIERMPLLGFRPSDADYQFLKDNGYLDSWTNTCKRWIQNEKQKLRDRRLSFILFVCPLSLSLIVSSIVIFIFTMSLTTETSFFLIAGLNILSILLVTIGVVILFLWRIFIDRK